MTTYQGELTLQEVVKLIEAEMDEGGNILEELTDQDIRGIYEQLSHEDKRRFRQFRKFHSQYFGVYGEHLPSYHMARQVMKDLMPGLPSTSVDVIAAKRAELLARPLKGTVSKTWLQVSRMGNEGRGAMRRRG